MILDSNSITAFFRNWLKDQLSGIERELSKKVTDPNILQELISLPKVFAMNENGEVTKGAKALSLLEYGSAGYNVPALRWGSRMKTILENQMTQDLNEF